MFEKCPNCSKRMLKGSKFCTHCGEKMPVYSQKKRRTVNKKFAGINLAESKRVFNRYKKYFIQRLKEPTVSMKKSMNKESFQFGLVQLIIFMLINSFTVLAMYGNTYSLNFSPVSLFVGAIVLQGLFFLNMVISLYISTNYLKNVPTQAQTIISRIGGLATPQLILSLILYLSVQFRIGALSYVIFILME